MVEIRYQPLPDLLVGQDATQWEPATVATTVTLADVPRRTLTAAVVDVPVRTFTLAQAGAIVVAAGAGAGVFTGMLDPPSANRQAK